MGMFSSLGGLVDMFTGMPGVGSTVGSFLDGAQGRNDQGRANQTNIDLARETMGFQKEMSNTSYQRAVKDMEAAGLNPMLAYSQGGASTPSGSLAHVEPKAPIGASTALQGAQTQQAISQRLATQAGIDQTIATTEKIKSETMTNQANTAKQMAEIKNLEGSTRKQQAEAQNTEQAILGTINDSATKHAVFEAMNKGGGFSADVRRRVSESSIAGSEAAKARVTKSGYDFVDQNIRGKATNSAKRALDWLGAEDDNLSDKFNVIKGKGKTGGSSGSW